MRVAIALGLAALLSGCISFPIPPLPVLYVNKAHTPTGASVAIGMPVTYVIVVGNTGGPNAQIRIQDAWPSGFIFTGASCTGSSAFAICPSMPVPNGLNPPPATLSNFSIPQGDSVTLLVHGYFSTCGPKQNVATAKAGAPFGIDLPVGSLNAGTDSLLVPCSPLPIDISIDKAVDLTQTNLNFPNATIHYSITVKGDPSSPIYLGGILKLTDQLTSALSVSASWLVTNYKCVASSSPNQGTCPDDPVLSGLSALLPPGTPTKLFQVGYTTGMSGTNDLGFMDKGSSFKIEFDVKLTTPATCHPKQIESVSNYAFLELSNGSTNIGDQDIGNNSTQIISSELSGLPECFPGVTFFKCQGLPDPNNLGQCLPSSPAQWGQAVPYTVFVNNSSNATITIPVKDTISKNSSTPAFDAYVSSAPGCFPGPNCPQLSNLVVANPATVMGSYSDYSLWNALIYSLPPGISIIPYQVIYFPVCEVDSNPNEIFNKFEAVGIGSQTITTKMPEGDFCQLQVVKTPATGNIQFEVPYTYTVYFRNISNTDTVDVGTVRDVLSLRSDRYGTLPFDYTVSCHPNPVGSVSFYPPLPTGAVVGNAKYEVNAWEGVRLIDVRAGFDPNSELMCNVTVTAHQPVTGNPFCQGGPQSPAPDAPQWSNMAWMDVSEVVNTNLSQKPFFNALAVADLPLCRSVIVTKALTNASSEVTPGSIVTYAISVENQSDDPLDGFTLVDNVLSPLVPISVSTPCTPVTSCFISLGLSGNTATATYKPILPKTVVTFDLKVKVPMSGGTYNNVAVGSFSNTGNYYFQLPSSYLQDDEKIGVVTPKLTKSFNPSKIGPNGSTVLTFNIANVQSTLQTGISFVDSVPPGFTASIVSNSCAGTVAFGAGQATVDLNGGAVSANSSCKIEVKLTAVGRCGVFVNDASKFPMQQLVNIDISEIGSHSIEVTGCLVDLAIRKYIKNPPNGLPSGTFTFSVSCQTSTGPLNSTVSISWPNPVLGKMLVPVGSTCTVVEVGTPPLPKNCSWVIPTYGPPGGVVNIGPTGGSVLVTNSMYCAPPPN